MSAEKAAPPSFQDWIFIEFNVNRSAGESILPVTTAGWRTLFYTDSQRISLGRYIAILYNNTLDEGELRALFESTHDKPMLLFFHQNQTEQIRQFMRQYVHGNSRFSASDVRRTWTELKLALEEKDARALIAARALTPKLEARQIRGLTIFDLKMAPSSPTNIESAHAQKQGGVMAKPTPKTRAEQIAQEFFWDDLSYKRVLFHLLVAGELSTADLAKRVTVALSDDRLNALIGRLTKREIVRENAGRLSVDKGVESHLRDLFNYEFCQLPNDKVRELVNSIFDPVAPKVDKLVDLTRRVFGIFAGTLSDQPTNGSGFLSAFTFPKAELAFFVADRLSGNQTSMGLNAVALTAKFSRSKDPQTGRYTSINYLPVLAAPAFDEEFIEKAGEEFAALHLMDLVSIMRLDCIVNSKIDEEGKRQQLNNNPQDLFAASPGGILDVEQGIKQIVGDFE